MVIYACNKTWNRIEYIMLIQSCYTISVGDGVPAEPWLYEPSIRTGKPHLSAATAARTATSIPGE